MSEVATKREWKPNVVVDLKLIENRKRFALMSFSEIKLGSERRYLVKASSRIPA